MACVPFGLLFMIEDIRKHVAIGHMRVPIGRVQDTMIDLRSSMVLKQRSAVSRI